MTLAKAIEKFDFQRSNSVTLERKIEWLSQLDYKISSEINGKYGASNFESPTNTSYNVLYAAILSSLSLGDKFGYISNNS